MSVPAAPHDAPPGQPRKAALAAWIGSALEYYDFFIYGSAAALIFPKVFFDESDPADATLLSLATFGVAYAARPVGALFLGHFGDHLGRKKIMVFTLILMGLSTFLIGCLPTRAQVGGLAPVLLVLCRVLQGVSAAGEQASANSMTLEHAPPHRRGYFTSFTLNGTQAGQLLATLVFLPVAALPEDQLLSWGWRVPFWLSVAVAVAGYVIRRTLQETPAFAQQAAADGVAKLPLAVLLREHWADVLRVVAAALIASVSTIFTVWALAYATSDSVGLSRSSMLWVGALANLVALGAIPLWAVLSDRVGRRPVFLIGAVGSAVLMFLYLWAISTGSYPLVLLLGVLTFGVVYSAANGIWPSFYGEMFSTRVRLSGMAIGTQIGFAVAGFAVTFAAQIAGPDGDDWSSVALFASALCIPPIVAALTARETHKVPTELLGERPAQGAANRETVTA
ncbi:MFS transporter [Streptomyces avermitilis]|uniref:3-(2-hydroxyphenyl) propionic acid transporter n=2 Tax=Streptomyces avermitilis TaxID=33903 RepID=Q82M81_STRAW|nr:MFS transporter [Streptomyces avermitilis]MYS97405.1 MFS transporter [Streptomyces sp. SID5469]KUN55933.1 MFS transporter [Streptomyces avermitilis]OOV25305.1 MFS transporter [Streptomyces avermitilis]BAC69490.1 putative 3-(2-hydroxyphenyl) propionic acid transporter [Streptomyces avermitilis MA-4680 = NBRC 14893]BBJ49489.1 MFS transporter [Streptomyces avermitilis]